MNENLQVIRSLYDAFARGDVAAMLGGFAPDINWTEAEGFPYGGTYTGPNAVAQNVFVKLGTEWDGFTAAPHEFVADGATVVAIGNYSGTYRATGKHMHVPFAHVWKLADGKVVSFHQHTDTVVVARALQ